ncbi:MAG: hypothetical protein HOE48_01760 [Candidatus Latescibacteria bacterium]|jgi:hypothetical protein|nr:hypothetical protein [Candidatus Latescibacterota bacterium]MBT4136605.1 hypothetical protein [Candidatus Latescibacterota bacterium]
MIRIDFGTLYEFEEEDTKLKQENRKKIADFIALSEQHNATIVEQRDWGTQDLIHYVGISPYIVTSITISDKYLAIQTSQIREKFTTYKADYVSVPDRMAVSIEQPPIEKMELHEVISCPHCHKKTPYDGIMQHCVHCGDTLDNVIKVCPNGEQKVAFHPSFIYCPNCGTELIPEIYEGLPLTEMDPNCLIWGMPLQDETHEDEDPFPGDPPTPPFA